MKMRLKYLFLVVVISASTVLTSCNKDDESPSNSIVGTWAYSNFNLDILVNGKTLNAFFVQDMGLSPSQAAIAEILARDEFFDDEDFKGLTIKFNANGTYSIMDFGVEEESGTYQLTNNDTKLRMTSDGDTQEFDIKTLTGNNLSLELTEEFEEDISEDGNDENIIVKLTLNMTK